MSDDRLKTAERLLADVLEDLSIALRVPGVDSAVAPQLDAIRVGGRRAFGAIMSSASAQWRKYLAEKHPGLEGGEFVSGPCRSVVARHVDAISAFLLQSSGDRSEPVGKTLMEVFDNDLPTKDGICFRCGEELQPLSLRDSQAAQRPYAPCEKCQPDVCPHDGGTCHHGCERYCFREKGGMYLTEPHEGFPLPGHSFPPVYEGEDAR